MEKDLEGALVNSTEAKLEGSKKPYMDLGGHLEYIESLLEQGTGGDEYASLTLPSTSPSSQVIPSITTSNEQQNLTIGNGLEIKDGALTWVPKSVSLSINITAQEMAAACSNDVIVNFESSDDVSKARELLLSGEGTIKVKVTTPLGWFNFIFYPNVCDESVANSFNFSNVCVLPVDLSSIGGGSKVNVFAMRVITWNWNDTTTVSFRFSITDFLPEHVTGGDVDAKIAALKEYVDASIGQAVTNVLTEGF